MPASKWTDERLQRLFDRYNRVYWKDRIRRYAVLNRHLEGCAGLCERSRRRITIDVKQHPSDASVRATLLHEMAHAADRHRQRLAHGVGFWAELEMLLKKRAPIRVDRTEMPGFTVQSASIPLKFRLCRKAVENVERRLDRQVPKGVVPKAVMEPDILGRFEEVGFAGVSWKDARLVVGAEFGLLDVGGRPINEWARSLMWKGRAEHRDALQMRNVNQKFAATQAKRIGLLSDAEPPTHDKVRALAYLPEFIEADFGVRSFIAGAAIPLFGIEGSKRIALGTATLFMFDRRYFLVTADHVHDAIQPENLTIGADRDSRMVTGPGDVTILRSGFAPADLSIIELHDPLVIARLTEVWTVLTEENVGAVTDTTGMFLIAGYPLSTRVRADRPGRPLVIGARGCDRPVRNADDPFNPEHDVLLEWNPEAFDVLTKRRIPSPRLQGMSGASVWQVFPVSREVLWSPRSQVRVVGVQNSAAHGEYIRVKKWHLLWSAIREACPTAAAKVRRSIKRHFETGR